MLFSVVSTAALLIGSTAAQNSYRYTNISGSGGPYVKDVPNYSSFLSGFLNPLVSNSFPIQGFNFTQIRDPMNPPFTNSDSTWFMELRLNSVPVNVSQTNPDSEDSEPVTVDYLAFALGSQGVWPDANDTQWQICGSALTGDFPANITNIEGPEDTSNGSCVPYFGQECVDAYTYALSHANTDANGCPRTPSFSDLPACRSQMGFFSHTVMTTTLMNVTSIDTARNYSSVNNTWYNTTTGETIEPDFRPLRSGEPFGFEGWSPRPAASDAEFTHRGTALRFAALSFLPKPGYYEGLEGISFAYIDTNVRLICGRPNRGSRTQEGELVDESGVGRLTTSSSMALLMSILVAVLLLS